MFTFYYLLLNQLKKIREAVLKLKLFYLASSVIPYATSFSVFPLNVFHLAVFFLYLPPGTVMESWSQVSSWHMNNESKMLRAKNQHDLRGIKT